MSFREVAAKTERVLQENALRANAREGSLFENIDSLTPEEVDMLPFGAIELNTNGIILKYNDFESAFAGVPKTSAIGKNFFTQVAPCTNVQEFHGRFKKGVAAQELHETFHYHFAFKHNPCNVTITLLYSEVSSTVWVFVRPS
ncbi:MAG TPA: PAS domain-containing protein [Candidatus Angelobacter sp.]|jgi:photoactive yellow protein|nr:PAS domain-containing protein [Candidatus Angelobacter sp.]